MKPLPFAASITTTLFILLTGTAQAETTLNIATVNNPDMMIMRALSQQFEEENPSIKLEWQLFSENELRQLLAKSYLEQIGRSNRQDPLPSIS